MSAHREPPTTNYPKRTMKARPRTDDDDDGGGLDSLLDTMTNVVGILVMVLIATQLGVKDAVDRISDSDMVDPAKLEETQEKLKLTLEKRDSLENQLKDLKPADEKTIQVQLADLRRRREQTQQQIAQEKQNANKFATKIKEDEKKAAEAKKKIQQIADTKAKREQLQKNLKTSLEEEARLKALLDDTPTQRAPPPKIVTLPDPRPAPEGAKPVYFLCAQNKIYPIPADDLRTIIRKQAEGWVKSQGLADKPVVGPNKERFLKTLNSQLQNLGKSRAFKDLPVDVEIYASGIYPRLRFKPREKAGFTEREVKGTKFQKGLLGAVDWRKYYARFIVLPDSYDVYLTTREVVQRKEILAGWEPQSDAWQYTTHLGGSVLFGVRPPPPKPDPNAKPGPKPKPQNVLD